MDGTNTYMPVMPANSGFGDGLGNGWWIILLFLFLGWALGCLIAEIIDKRKTIASWLKTE